MELNRVDRRVINWLGIEMNGRESEIEIYSRIRMRYENPDRYFSAAHNAIDRHFNLSFSQHVPQEYRDSIDRLNPFLIHKP
jgi:hypothetical protein